MSPRKPRGPRRPREIEPKERPIWRGDWRGRARFLARGAAAAAGIGRGTAEAFAREGARVIATDIDIAGLEGLDANKRKLDVRSTEAVEALAREVGPIDVLFNCAGF